MNKRKFKEKIDNWRIYRQGRAWVAERIGRVSLYAKTRKSLLLTIERQR